MSRKSTTVHAWGPGPTVRQLAHETADAVLALPLFLVTPLLRPWHRRWGATDQEAAASMLGDDLVKGCQYVVTRAITIDAAPEQVWPWLVQIGFGKAGYYSNDLLDNFGHPSADRIIAEFQQLQVGDWVPMFSKVNDTTAFRVRDINPCRSLLWSKPDSTWSWLLTPNDGATRLLTRIRILYRWQYPAEALFSLLLNEIGDFAMMRRMLLNLRMSVERRHGHVA